jgi:predicted nucleic acid-binding protein
VAQFVLDASVALAWFFRDEESVASEKLYALTDDHKLIVPPHWFAEVANGILIGERRGRCAADEVPLFIEQLSGMSFAIDAISPFGQFEMILPLARAHSLTVYDAIYLHLAQSHRSPLATFDKKLIAAARALGVTILGN